MKRVISLVVFFGMTFFIASCGQAALKIEDSWARPGIPGGNSAIYFIVENSTDEPDVLLGVELSVAASVEMHRTVAMEMDNEGGEDDGGLSGGQVMKMEEQDQIEIPARSDVVLEPGGLHIMLIDLADGLEPGDEIMILLRFQAAGEVEQTVIVEER